MRKMIKRMGAGILHVLILLVVFIAALLYFERSLNMSTPDTADSMSESTFPLIYMQRGGVNFNCLHGYARRMDTSSVRESITPLSSDRQIGIHIEAFSATIDSVSYQVLTLDGSEQLENTQVIKLEQEGSSYEATLQLQNKLLMDQEYVLCIEISGAGRQMYYYTHVVLADGLHTDEYLDFVNGFYDKTVNATDLDSVAAAVEPDSTTDEDQSLAHMDIHDSVSQLTWGSLNPQIYYKPIPRITEINDNTATLTLEYRIAAVNERGVTEVFNINEYYRVRFTDSRVFLLNFERSTDEIFNPEDQPLESIGIRLGITDKEINYKADEKNRIIAFVQENELWSYERSTSKLTQVFSFPQKENMDYRDFYNAHEITILRVSSNGDIWFTVEGYMNRGTYEGENGVCVCFYDAATDTVDEKIFLASTENHELLEETVSETAYISEGGTLFSVLIENVLYQVNLTDLSYEGLLSNVADGCYVGSTGRYFAYLPEGSRYGSSSLIQVDLETGESMEITAPDGAKIMPVTYMNEDLVYGLAYDTDLEAAVIESGFFPMYCLKIVDGEGNELKTYETDTARVTSVEQADHMLSLTLMSLGSDGWTAAGSDQIMDTNTGSSVNLGTATSISSRKQTEVYLRVGGTISDLSPDIVRSKVLSRSQEYLLNLPQTRNHSGTYYVYAAGGLYDSFTQVNEAIRCADEQYGVVIDSEQRYIWVRGDKSTSAEIQLSKVPAAMASGLTDPNRLMAGADVDVLDLTGCTLDEVLYFVSHGTPVAAMTEEGPVTIVGYNEYNTFLLDPDADEWYYYGINDSTERFAAAGNVFYTYID